MLSLLASAAQQVPASGHAIAPVRLALPAARTISLRDLEAHGF